MEIILLFLTLKLNKSISFHQPSCQIYIFEIIIRESKPVINGTNSELKNKMCALCLLTANNIYYQQSSTKIFTAFFKVNPNCSGKERKHFQ